MKKALSLLLALVMCLSLCACGGGNETPETPEATTEAPTTPESITAESLAGTYKTRLWFLNHTITLNANTSYDFGADEKGTFKLDENAIALNSKNENRTRRFVAGDNCIYTFESWRFDKDKEYGLAFSPDANGMADQTFEACVLNSNMPGCGYNWICLDLNTNGSFVLKLGNRTTTSLDVAETFEGTYTSDTSSLTLTYNGQSYPLILNNANHINFFIYDKV